MGHRCQIRAKLVSPLRVGAVREQLGRVLPPTARRGAEEENSLHGLACQVQPEAGARKSAERDGPSAINEASQLCVTLTNMKIHSFPSLSVVVEKQRGNLITYLLSKRYLGMVKL